MTPQSDDVFDQGGGFITYPNVANLSVVLKKMTKMQILSLKNYKKNNFQRYLNLLLIP
ncbi:hypothetical protein GCM10020331_094810 [Ectobacillus funiculus]